MKVFWVDNKVKYVQGVVFHCLFHFSFLHQSLEQVYKERKEKTVIKKLKD